MMQSLPSFLIFWAVWILIPILVDGFDLIYHLVVITFFKRTVRRRKYRDDDLPTISVIVPAHNEEYTVDRVINSLKVQDYPHDRLEVIVVDDGSTDGTAGLVQEHVNGNGKNGNGKNGKNGNGIKINGKFIPVGDFTGVVKLMTKGKSGKASALNTGIEVAHGDIIINIDADVVLAPGCLRATAEAFANDKTLAAATGNIRISWDIVEERDENGDLVLDAEGRPVTRTLGAHEMWLARCQFLEYLSAFSLGREAQDATRTMYTLAGAYSAFRRDIIKGHDRYRQMTVSEDTDLTFDIHQRKEGRVGFVREAVVYVEPLLDWDELYAQRVRWHRGQIEVCAAHQQIIANRTFGPIGTFGLPKMLLVDHSMAFPRLIWILLLPVLIAFGYSASLIFWAIVVMYGFYLTTELAHALVERLLVDDDTKPAVRGSLATALSMPLYRFVLFYFRLAGYLDAMLEPPTWTVRGPIDRTRGAVRAVQTAIFVSWGGFMSHFSALRPVGSLAALARGFASARRVALRLAPLAVIAMIAAMLLFGGITQALGR